MFNFLKDKKLLFFEHMIYGEFDKAILLRAQSQEVQTYPYALHVSAYVCNLDMVQRILTYSGNSINNLDTYFQNALHYAVNEFRFDFFGEEKYKKYVYEGISPSFDEGEIQGTSMRYVENNKWKNAEKIISVIDALIDAGINIDQENKDYHWEYQTPLYYPIASKNIKVAKHLIKRGAKVNHVTKDGLGLLNWFDYLCKYRFKSVSNEMSNFRKYLLDKGAILTPVEDDDEDE